MTALVAGFAAISTEVKKSVDRESKGLFFVRSGVILLLHVIEKRERTQIGRRVGRMKSTVSSTDSPPSSTAAEKDAQNIPPINAPNRAYR